LLQSIITNGEKKMKSAILNDFRRSIIAHFEGIAIVHQPSLAEGEYGPIYSEKVLKFNRKALRSVGKRKVEKVDPRMVGGEDTMILPVGKPGSRERVEALAAQYAAASGEEISPFWWDDDGIRKAVEDNAMSMEEYNALPQYRG
jgi:hypothetical protein